MFPFNPTPYSQTTAWRVFYADKRATSWQTYMIPPGSSMLNIIMLGAGAGGAAVATSTLGAGGGGSGGFTKALIPTFLLPDLIYIRPGPGGLGATTATGSGSDGGTSYVSLYPDTATAYRILSASGGTGAAGNLTNAAGAGAAASATGNNPFAATGIFISIAGQAGTAGAASANTAGTSLTPGASGLPITGGMGGGSGTAAGGGLSAAGLWPAIAGGASQVAGRPGFQQGLIISPGQQDNFPFIFSGGTGGGGGPSGLNGGRGGDGGYGCGGGGGGGPGGPGTAGFGPGGDGGDGLVIIGAF